MKLTLSNLEKRVEALEARPGIVPQEPIHIRVVYATPEGPQEAVEYETTRWHHQDTGQEIIIEYPKDY